MKPLQHTVKAKIIEILLQWARKNPLYHQKTSSNSTWDFLHITRWGGGSERDKEINETSNGYSFSLLWSIDWAEDHLSAVQSSQCLPSSKEHQEKLQRVFQTPQETETIVEANAWGAFDGSQTHLQCCLDFHHCVLIHCVLKLSPPLPLIFCPQASLHTCFIALLLAESQLNKQDHCKNVPEALMKVHCSALCKRLSSCSYEVWNVHSWPFPHKASSHRPHTFRVRAAYSLCSQSLWYQGALLDYLAINATLLLANKWNR